MTLWLPRRATPLLAGLILGAGLVGCGGKPAPTSEAAPEVPDDPKPVATKTTPAPAAPAGGDRLHQTFAQATRPADDPPPDSDRPPDTTAAGKPVFALLQAVAREWDRVRFVTPDGKKVHYSATVETSLGTFQMNLLPEVAPNHVRNFVALARAGYYDGLCFDRARQEGEGEQALRAVEGGCPLGTGETAGGSIGYWLKDEPTPGDKVSHVEGVVGACRGEASDTAACRFYITLSRAPYLDGHCTIFGQLTSQGLDVARRIYQQPVIVDDQDRDGARRPEKPAVLRKVTIHTREQ